MVCLDTLGEVRERQEARQEYSTKLRVVLNPAVERQGVKERIQGHLGSLVLLAHDAFPAGEPLGRVLRHPVGELGRLRGPISEVQWLMPSRVLLAVTA